MNENTLDKSRAAALDRVILAGGTWDQILAAADAAVVNLKTKVKKHDRAFIHTHIRYRTKQKPNFFDSVKETEAGFELVKAKK